MTGKVGSLARGVRITARGFEHLLRDHDKRCRVCNEKVSCKVGAGLEADWSDAKAAEARMLPVVLLRAA